MIRKVVSLTILCLCATTAHAQGNDSQSLVPNLARLVGTPGSELAGVVDRFGNDRQSINRRYDAAGSPAQRKRMREFYSGWSSRLAENNFDKLSQEGKIDYVLLSNYIKHQLVLMDRQDTQRSETAALAPFADRLLSLQDARRDLKAIDSRNAANVLASVSTEVDSLRTRYEATATAPKVNKALANRAADNVDQIRGVIGRWYKYYDGYDPIFSWWVKEPYKRLDESLTRYTKTLREKVVGFKPAQAGGAANDGPIIGDPISRKGLDEDLAYEMIPYTPEELIAIAEREYAFSLSEMKKASREMGFGGNWKAAMKR